MICSQTEEERRPLLLDQESQESEIPCSQPKSLWARFRQPSPSWIVGTFMCFVIVTSFFAIPDLNATLALICHQQFPASLAHSNRGSSPPDLLDELSQCLGNEHAQSALARFLIYGQVIAGFLSAISCPILGSLSDSLGRKPILACSAFGLALYDSVILLVLRHPDSIDYHWLLVGSAIEGLTGSIIIALPTSQAYIVDLTNSQDRASPFSYLQAALAVSHAVGPIISAILIKAFKSLVAVYAIGLYAHLSLGMVFLCVLPESRSRPSGTHKDDDFNGEQLTREPESLKSSAYAALPSFKSLWETSAPQRRNIIILAVLEVTVFSIGLGTYQLQLAYPAYLFHWQPEGQSLFMALINSWSILVLVLIFPLAMTMVRNRASCLPGPKSPSVFNVGEISAIQLLLLLQGVGYLAIVLSQHQVLFISSSLIVASAAPALPLLTSCLTAHVPSDHTGQLLGALSFLHAIARIIIPASLNALYSSTIGWFPQALFVVLATVFGGLFLASICIQRNRGI